MVTTEDEVKLRLWDECKDLGIGESVLLNQELVAAACAKDSLHLNEILHIIGKYANPDSGWTAEWDPVTLQYQVTRDP